jgi:hypothetical protein
MSSCVVPREANETLQKRISPWEILGQAVKSTATRHVRDRNSRFVRLAVPARPGLVDVQTRMGVEAKRGRRVERRTRGRQAGIPHVAVEKVLQAVAVHGAVDRRGGGRIRDIQLDVAPRVLVSGGREVPEAVVREGHLPGKVVQRRLEASPLAGAVVVMAVVSVMTIVPVMAIMAIMAVVAVVARFPVLIPPRCEKG